MASSKELLKDLFKIGAIKFGSFKLKSGLISPIYIDLRVTISYPKVLRQIAELMWEKVGGSASNFDFICGVPYTALPFASCISLMHELPMLIRRKEGPKDYGTKKTIEGVFEKGQSCLVLEDLVTTGGSVLEVVESLRSEGLVAKVVVVVLDREQGARKALEDQNLVLHSIFTMTEMLNVLESEKILEKEKVDMIRNFISSNQIAQAPEPSVKKEVAKPLTFSQRAVHAHPLAKQLFEIMESKKSNLAVAVDLTKKSELLNLADKVGSQICLLKLHVDIIEDFDMEFVNQLTKLAEKHNFLLFEDRKFADIGNTVKLQYSKGVYHIADWAHITNAHIIPGKGIIDGLKEAGKPKGRGLLLLAEMSSEGSLATGKYTEEAVKMALENKDFVVGFISQRKLTEEPGLLHMTPGVQLSQGTDSLGQQYNTPESVVTKNGSDIIIVGRGIYGSSNPEIEAQKYREAGWLAYEKRHQ